MLADGIFFIFNLNCPCPRSFGFHNFILTITPTGANAQNNSVPGKPVVSMPATNLNIGMDLWNASSGGAGAAKGRPNPSGASSALAPPTMIGCEGVLPEQWMQV